MLIFISSGQTSSGINLTSDTIDVLSGGLATHTTVNSDGELYVSKGGTATDTTINPDGYLAVLSGGLATRTTVNSGGFLCVYSGGLASSTAVCFGGQMALEGGTATGTTVNNGYLFVYSSSYLEDIQFQGDVDYLQGEENGRTLSNVRICENTRVYVGANIQGLTVEAGGFTDYQWGGSAFGVDVYGSLQLWNPFGNTDLVYAEDMVIHSGGYVAAGRAAFVSKTIVSSGGRLYLNYSTEEEKGTAKDTYVLEGGVASATSVGNYFLGYLRIGGRVSVYSAQVLKDVGSIDFELGDVSSNSYLYVADGSLAGATVITADVTNAFGKYTLIEGGSANLQTIIVTNDNTSSALSVGQTISVSAVKSVTLTVSNNNLYLQVSINDTTPPDLPGNIGATLDGNVLSMHWDSVTDLTGVVYEVEYSNDPGFADNVFTETFTTAGGTLTLGNGDWYWRIRSKDGAGNYSAWSKSSSATINHTDIVEGRFVQPQDFSSDVIIKPTAVVECAYPAAIRLNSSDSTVTVEGGTLSCNSIRNACILFGEDADTTGNSHLLHSDGTVTFTVNFAK